MCGIVGAAARRDIVPILVEGLRRLEYRGYDSCGVAALGGGQLARVRSVARVEDLAGQISKQMYEMYMNIPPPEGCAPFVTYLCSEDADDINGAVFGIKAGEIGIYAEPVEKHVLHKESGLWTHEELVEQVPKVLLKGYVNPAPRKD